MKRVKKVVGTNNIFEAVAEDLTIGPNDGSAWSEEKMADVAAFAKHHNSKRSSDRLRRNAMLAVYYSMELYLQDDSN